MANAMAALECPKFALDNSRERLAILFPPPSGIEDGGGRKEDGARLNTCGACGWSKPKGVEPTCAHAARGPVILLSPPHERTVPSIAFQRAVVPASSMSVTTSRWLGTTDRRGATKTER